MKSVNDFTVLGKDVLILIEKNDNLESDTGIIIKMTEHTIDRQTSGKIVKVGEKVKKVTVGQTAHWERHAGIDMEFEEGKYLLIRQKMIIGVSE